MGGSLRELHQGGKKGGRGDGKLWDKLGIDLIIRVRGFLIARREEGFCIGDYKGIGVSVRGSYRKK